VTLEGALPSVGPRRVVMVEPTPGMRGPQRTMLALARYLAPRVPLVVAVPEGFVSKVIRADVPDAELLALPFHRRRTTSWLHGAAALMRLKGGDGTLIHANGLSGLNLAAPLARRLDAPVVVHFHAGEVTARSRAFLEVWRWMGVRTVFLPVSMFSRAVLEAAGVRIPVSDILPNPIEQTKQGARAAPRRPFRVGWMGSKSPRKGLHHLVRIASLLREESMEWHLYGVDQRAPTPYVERCLAEIGRRDLSDRFMWHGRVVDTGSAYARMDALLVPSQRESFARVAAEAMAHGIPVVAARVGGVPEVIPDGVAGLLFDSASPDDAATHLRSLMDDPLLWQELSSNAARLAERFDVTTIGRMLEGFYAGALEDGNGSAPSRREERRQTPMDVWSA
jgi:glycosyltransferase involved in cell wall biosynthesis